VLFRYKPAGRPKAVTLAGTFNDWKVNAQPMGGPDEEGFYAVRLVLKRGFYEYKFVLGGKTWEADPTNLHTSDPYGNSMLTVGGSP
jgi:1,4-alpha-glucan branching enzyme